MPKLSLYRPNKQNDYKFFDRTISEMLTVGGTDLYIHKYLGPKAENPSIDYTQPQYDAMDPTNIQDLLFLENRDRKYDPNIYRLRGHYNVQNLDFDLSQFGLFLNNDIIFITVHYNDMIDILGRKLMVGDVLELPHLLDYNPLNEKIPTALRRFYQVTDGNFASEGFSQTWFYHLWRIKCEPLINSQEFADILSQPINTDNYLGDWDKDKIYPPGYVITYGDKNYIAKIEVPRGIYPPNDTYWQLDTQSNLADILSTYNKNLSINDAIVDEAKRIIPKSGYDNTNLYVAATYGPYGSDGKFDEPAPPIDIVVQAGVGPIAPTGTVAMIKSKKYPKAPVIRIKKEQLKSIWDMTADTDGSMFNAHVTMQLQTLALQPDKTDTGSGAVEPNYVLSVESLGQITGPYGTADNTYATADQDPTQPGFTGTISQQMDFRADCDPRFQYIARSSPRSFGYSYGYLTGDGTAPNGFPLQTGIAFPANPTIGDYFLRIDYLPNLLFRWDGAMWVRISENVRTDAGYTEADRSLQSTFINNPNITVTTDGGTIPERQPLSSVLQITPDTLPPVL